jgi:hypothetical protein
MADGFKQLFGNIRQSELIPTAFCTVYGDEINLLLRINPQRDLVRQSFAAWHFHFGRIGRMSDIPQGW